MKAPKKPPQPTKAQEVLLRRYAVLMVRRGNKMIAGKSYSKEDAEQARVSSGLEKLKFNLDSLYLTMWDYGYVTEAIQKEEK